MSSPPIKFVALQYPRTLPRATTATNAILHSFRAASSKYLGALATAGVPSDQHARVGGYGSHDRVLVGCNGQRGTVAPDFDHFGQASSHTEVDKCLLGVCVGRAIHVVVQACASFDDGVVCVFSL